MRPELEGGIELMRHTLLDLGLRPRQIQDYANSLRESGYEALGDDRRAERQRALGALVASLSELELHWVEVGESCPMAGCALGALDLRARTGANAVALRHADEVEVFLDANTVLRAGDSVGLMGTAEQLSAAEALLG